MSEGNAQGDLENGSQGISVVHVTIPNQPVQVQSVIQSNQHSVIQSAGSTGNVQTIQVVRVAAVDDELSSDDSDAKKRREILARRPSYRKILNDLSSPVSKMDDESNDSQSQDGQESNEAAQNLTSSANAVQYQQATVVPAGAIQITTHPDGTPVSQGLQTLTMSNASPSTGAQGATIVQYAQGPDGQFYIPGTVSVGGTGVQAYQIATSGALPQGVVMAAAGSPITSPGGHGEEASRKRELRLLKNREAARECRRKKKEYVKCLENRVAVLENQNKTLIEELKALKELYCQKDT
ncbi:cAMP-responsive element modulator-like isoform X2 [Haliotis rubra]|nr:cAMP-responsive element modulator-like isoform X2 [Haliotis rufescens]XP_046345697.1 cAMP-responsive element modulator-like isoform X2 [Haliotis rufescens]XP_046556592.1 cAMP-responsive element modulator-like isoform X2 [Haliotis rubra]